MTQARGTGQPQQSVHKRIVDNASMGVLILRQEAPGDPRSFRMTYANGAASEASRTSMDRMVGTMIVDSFPNVTDDLLQTYVHVIETGLPASIGELRYGDENVPEGVFSLTVSHLGNREVAVIYENVTERLRAESALRAGRESAARLAEENAALAEIGRLISLSPNIEDVYEGFADHVSRLIPSDRVAISVLHSDGVFFSNEHVAGPNLPGRMPGEVVALEGTLIESAVRRRVTQIVHGEPSELRSRFSNLILADLRSSLLAPVIHRGKVIAVLSLRSAEPDRYTDRHRVLAERVAAQIAGTIANAQTYAEQRRIDQALRESEETARQMAEENAARAEIGRIISQSMDFDDIYRRFAEEVGNIIPVERIVIGLADEEGSAIVNAYVAGVDVPGRRRGDSQRLRGTLSEAVIQAGAGRIIHVAQDDTGAALHFPGLLPEIDAGIRSFLSVPLASPAGVKGCLHIRSTRENVYSEDHLRTGERVGLQIAGAIANSQLYAQLESAKDELERQADELTHSNAELEGAKAELERQADELTRSNAELEQFASVASHDLQQPLRAISGHIRLLSRRYKGKLDSDADDFLGFVSDGAERMQLLIDALLEYAQVGASAAPMAPTDCEEALAHAASNVQAAAAETRSSITHDALPRVKGDATQLVQLFQNLLSNAIKFRADRPPAIHVSSARRGDRYLIGVSDNGIGIPEAHVEDVFGMFKRLHGRGRYPGTGLGLAICSKIVDRHGGRIWVESQQDRGSTFYFELEAVD